MKFVFIFTIIYRFKKLHQTFLSRKDTAFIYVVLIGNQLMSVEVTPQNEDQESSQWFTQTLYNSLYNEFHF